MDNKDARIKELEEMQDFQKRVVLDIIFKMNSLAQSLDLPLRLALDEKSTISE